MNNGRVASILSSHNNTLGQLILTQQIEKDQTTANFDVQNLPPAPYYVVVTENGQTVFNETLIKK